MSFSYGPGHVLRWAQRTVKAALGQPWVDLDGSDAGPYTGALAFVVRPTGDILPVSPTQFSGPGQYTYERMGVQVDLATQPRLGSSAQIADWDRLYEPAYKIKLHLEDSASFETRDGEQRDTVAELGGIQVVTRIRVGHYEEQASERGPAVFGLRSTFAVQFTRLEVRR